MPYLGDYLGQLLSEITMARVQADLESVRTAEVYASHPLLKHLPVPHVRLPTIELNVPVIIGDMAEPRAGETTRGGVDPDLLRQAFNTVLARQVRSFRIRMTPDARERLRVELDKGLAGMLRPQEVRIDTNRIADGLAGIATRVVRETGTAAERMDRPPRPERAREDPADYQTEGARDGARQPPDPMTRFGEALREDARLNFLGLRSLPPRLTVLVTSQQIREAEGKEGLMYLKLSIAEEAFEWTLVETPDGEMEERLIPE